MSHALTDASSFTTQLDLWALGVTIYTWVVGTLPFKGSAPFLMYDNIKTQPVHLPDDAPISRELTDFIHRCGPGLAWTTLGGCVAIAA